MPASRGHRKIFIALIAGLACLGGNTLNKLYSITIMQSHYKCAECGNLVGYSLNTLHCCYNCARFLSPLQQKARLNEFCSDLSSIIIYLFLLFMFFGNLSIFIDLPIYLLNVIEKSFLLNLIQKNIVIYYLMNSL